MASTPDPMVAVLRTLLRHGDPLNTVALVIADQARLLEHSFPRCDKGCDRAVTVVLTYAGGSLRCCDRCAASDVAHKRSKEEGWVDVKDAEQIRRMQDLVAISQPDEAAGPPTFH